MNPRHGALGSVLAALLLACGSSSNSSPCAGKADGTSCGGSEVCSAGNCVTPTCVAGEACQLENACATGTTQCSSPVATPVCTQSGTLPDLTACGTGSFCNGGQCLAATCVAGQACNGPTPCAAGSTTCSTPFAAPACGVTGNKADGTACGNGQVCAAGACVTGFTVGGSVSGLDTGKSVVLQNNGADNVTVSSNTTFTFPAKVGPGASYHVTVLTHPADQACTVTPAGATPMPFTDVTSVRVACSPILVQRWQPPATWGARWPVTSTMRQHAYFDGTTIHEDGAGITWSPQGVPQPQQKLTALPSGDRWGAGPFGGPGAGPFGDNIARWRYQATGDAAITSLDQDMTVCAVVKPNYNFPVDGAERVIIAKGFTRSNAMQALQGGGWILHQMHEEFCFHYQYRDTAGSNDWMMTFTATYFADQDQSHPQPGYAPGPLNPSYVVLCAGRDGNTLRIAVNSIETVNEHDLTLANAVLDLGSPPVPLTIGGLAVTPDPSCATSPYPCQNNDYLGRIYETAVWAEPATRANLAAKLAAFQGLVLPDGSLASYHRNREGAFVGPDGQYHTAWRHGPRVEAAQGMLFGGQSWNHLTQAVANPGGEPFHPYDVYGQAEDLSLWVASPSGATVGALDNPATPGITPPGDSEQRSVHQISLQPQATLTANVQSAFETAGPVLGQLWLNPVSTSGVLRVRLDDSGSASSTHADIDLAAGGGTPAYPPGKWTRVPLSGLSTSSGGGALVLQNAGTTPITFYAWGVTVTQLGGGLAAGGTLGPFDPGPYLYDWTAQQGLVYNAPPRAADDTGYHGSTTNYPQDALELPKPTTATGATGFCLAVDAQPLVVGSAATGLAWDAPLHQSRTALTWAADGGGQAASLLVSGADDSPARQLCFRVAGASTVTACAPVPATWAPGSKHNLKGCMSATGQVRLFGDDVLLGSPVAGPAALDLTTGHLIVGNAVATATSAARPWHGWISRVTTCKDPGDAAITACR